MTDLTPDQARLYAATIAGLIAIVRSEIADADTAEAMGQALAAGSLQLRVAIVITADRTAITAGIADGSKIAPIFTHETRTTWPAEFIGVGQPRH
jgi:phosphate/sulfate permease